MRALHGRRVDEARALVADPAPARVRHLDLADLLVAAALEEGHPPTHCCASSSIFFWWAMNVCLPMLSSRNSMYVSTFSVSSAFATIGLRNGSKSSSVMLSDCSCTGTVRALDRARP